MLASSIGRSVLETELIIDKAGGATSQKFTEMSDEELRRRCWAFPEARQELVKRFLEKIKIQVG